MASAPSSPWVDRVVGFLSPMAGLRRQRARLATELIKRHYEGAATGRRTAGWNRAGTDANASAATSLSALRNAARDLVRNNPYAARAVETIVNHTIGWGIVATAEQAKWKTWAGSVQCDADGQHDLAGLEKLVLRAVVVDGEVLIRRRWRRQEDGLALPFQLQLLEADYLDVNKTTKAPNGNRIIHGVEFDAIGRRVAYWLFPEHPGATSSSAGTLISGSQRVAAENIVHVFRQDRPGQVRGVSWFAPVLLRFKDFDEYEDATLMKQKIAACLAVITSDVDGTAPAIGVADSTDPTIDQLEPGMILNVPPGRSTSIVSPPSVNEYGDYTRTVLRAIATGIGVTYEDIAGDYTNLPFSAARMSRMRHWSSVQDWRWRLVVPQFLVPVWTWSTEAAAIIGEQVVAETEWTGPSLPAIDPDKEALALMRRVRAGQMTFSEMVRELGYNPKQFFAEMARDFEELDRLGLVLDSDPRKMTQAGQVQSTTTPAEPAAPAPSDEPAPEA